MNKLRRISILSGATQAKIAPGEEAGNLLSINNTEILYLDRETFNDLTKMYGRIPLLFPNAGPLKDGPYNLPQHGFTRIMLGM